jgi:antitoxin (DNA-binding transcriptional repressor) of toxin-antitoxin stability system
MLLLYPPIFTAMKFTIEEAQRHIQKLVEWSHVGEDIIVTDEEGRPLVRFVPITQEPVRSTAPNS